MDLEDIITIGVTAVNSAMFLSTIGLTYASYKYVRPGKGKNVIGVIPINGTISNKDSPGKVNSKKVIKDIEKMCKNPKIKGIIFDINSGGGVVYQSREIASYISRKVFVPKVAVARDVCASGAYMIACATDYIFAREESAVGSIGVITAHLAASGLLDKLGIEYDVLKAGRNKDAHLPFKKLTEEQKLITQEQIDEIYDLFIRFVAKHRYKNNRLNNPTEEDIRAVATGDVYYGRKSLQYRLIDEIGSDDEAIAYIERKGNFKHSGIHEIKSSSSPLSKFGMNIGTSIGESIADRLLNVDINKTQY